MERKVWLAIEAVKTEHGPVAEETVGDMLRAAKQHGWEVMRVSRTTVRDES